MVKMNLNNDRAILNDFRKVWTLERVQSMELDEYVNVKNPETFCQYVETRTTSLGSIKGLNSIKFGIYKRSDKTKNPTNAFSDNTHSWLKYYGNKKNDAFSKIKNDLIKIIEAAQKLEFEKIDSIHLHNIFKWKVAFLYSNEGFIPIFKKEALHIIAKKLGMEISKYTQYSEIHRYIAKNKPVGISVYDYMRELYTNYKIDQNTEKKATTKRKYRKGTKAKNTANQNRKGTEEYIATQFHNELQEKLKIYLSNKFGEKKVILEENYVDVKVTQPDEIYYYEVKTAGFAEDCIKQGIGQLLSYSFFENDPREKNLIIFGKNKPTPDEINFINFVKGKLKGLGFNYLSLEEIENE